MMAAAGGVHGRFAGPLAAAMHGHERIRNARDVMMPSTTLA